MDEDPITSGPFTVHMLLSFSCGGRGLTLMGQKIGTEHLSMNV